VLVVSVAAVPAAARTTSALIDSLDACNATAPARRPNLALCLAGHARTFGDPRVADGLAANLVAPFGANVTTFLYLKLHDRSTKGKTRAENLRAAVDTRLHAKHVEDIGVAASKLPAPVNVTLVGEDVVFRQPPCAHSREFRVADNATGTAWREEETWQMLVGQLHNQYWCGRAVDEYSRRTGVSFDVVIKSRPDVTFAGPAPPYCAFDYETKACSSRDWLFMLPGSVAVKALTRGYDEFLACRTLMNRNRTKIAEIVVRATGMGKELLPGMSAPDANCKNCKGKNDPCDSCRRKDTPLRLIRKPGVPSGSLAGSLPRACGF